MPRFMVLLQDDDNAWEQLSSEEKQSLMEKYFAWVDELKAGDHMRGGDPLATGGRVLRTESGEIVDGPYTETKEVLTGYFMIEAKDLDEASQLARGCPALGHGGGVIVRPVAEMDESGMH